WIFDFRFRRRSTQREQVRTVAKLTKSKIKNLKSKNRLCHGSTSFDSCVLFLRVRRMGPTPRHVPVLPAEVLDALAVKPGQVMVRATVGRGGHARLIADRLQPTGRLIGLDQDPAMLELAKARLEGVPVSLIHAHFDRLAEVLKELNMPAVDALLAD